MVFINIWVYVIYIYDQIIQISGYMWREWCPISDSEKPYKIGDIALSKPITKTVFH
jgi:hypothetical protein